MKVLFTASLTGKKYYLKNYQKIVSVLSKIGHTVISDHILKRERFEVEKQAWELSVEYQRDFHRWASQSELVVAEVSYPSTGVGYQITQAMDKGKPVLALYLEDKIPIALLGESSEKIIPVSYSLSTLEKELPNFVKEAVSRMDVRFNFFISPKIGAYLDWVSKTKKVPRAVYLRRLIEEDMTKSDYEPKKKKNAIISRKAKKTKKKKK